MKNLLIFCLFIPFFGHAQQIQYAQKVLKYSSDLGGKVNSVRRITGKPDAFPQGGYSANAWVPKNASTTAFVEVEFEKAQSVSQIAVFENLNAGCVTRVMVADASGKFKTVNKKGGAFFRWINKYQAGSNADRAYYFNKKRRKIEVAADVSHNADIAYFMLDQAEPNVKMVKIEFDFSIKPGQKQIDAIAISDSQEPIQPQINILEGTANLAPLDQLVYTADNTYSLSAIFVDGNQMYYTNTKDDNVSEIQVLDLANLNAVKEVSSQINQNNNLKYIKGYAAESKLMLIGAERKYIRGEEYLGLDFYHFQPQKFTHHQPLKVIGYNNYGDYSDMFYTKDGKQILFGIESDLTQGGYDIYFSKHKEESTFGLMENLGKSINSAADETNPFLLSDNKTLLFASNGYSSYGDFDIYVSTRLDDTWKNWSEPKNLGPVINSVSLDSDPYYDEKNEILYFVSFRNGVSTIQKVKLPLNVLTATSK